MGFENILYEVDAGIATITLNRPHRHNAFTYEMAGELREAWRNVIEDGDVVCAIVTGAGEKAFCTGMDVTTVADGSVRRAGQGEEREESSWFQLTAIHNRCWKPVITAVNGMVCGGGLHFIADSDLVVCAEHATFFDTHVNVGLIAGLEPVGLARRIPVEQVLRMAFLGGSERMSAQKALEIGLVGDVLPAEEVMPRARELADRIAQHSPTALARTKQAIWGSLDVGLDEGLGRAWDLIRKHREHPDLVEGPKAFVEKRRPRWAAYTGE